MNIEKDFDKIIMYKCKKCGILTENPSLHTCISDHTSNQTANKSASRFSLNMNYENNYDYKDWKWWI